MSPGNRNPVITRRPSFRTLTVRRAPETISNTCLAASPCQNRASPGSSRSATWASKMQFKVAASEPMPRLLEWIGLASSALRAVWTYMAAFPLPEQCDARLEPACVTPELCARYKTCDLVTARNSARERCDGLREHQSANIIVTPSSPAMASPAIYRCHLSACRDRNRTAGQAD